MVLNLFEKFLAFKIKKDFTSFSLSFNSKKLAFLYQRIFEKKIKIVLGLQSAIFAPFSNLKKIIIFDPKNFGYKNSKAKPFLDTRILAKILAQILKIPLEEIDPLKEFEEKPSLIKVVSLKETPEKILLEESSLKIKNSLKKKKSVLLIVNRKGYAPYLLCEDCFRILTCSFCEAPLVFYKKLNLKTLKIEPKLICRHCETEKEPFDFCPYCGGGFLKLSGIGIQKVKEKFPDFGAFLKEKGFSFKKEQNFIREIFSKKILGVISTPIISKWFWVFEDFFDFSVVLRAESFLSFPDYLSYEKFYYFLLRLKFISKNLVIQSFNPQNYLFKSLIKNDLKGFLKKELSLRKKLGLPPGFNFIKVILSSSKELEARKEAQKFAWQLKLKKIDFLGPNPSFIFKKRNRFFYEILIKLRSEQERVLVSKIIPSQAMIDVDPIEFG